MKRDEKTDILPKVRRRCAVCGGFNGHFNHRGAIIRPVLTVTKVRDMPQSIAAYPLLFSECHVKKSENKHQADAWHVSCF
jgi:hypothetical protein